MRIFVDKRFTKAALNDIVRDSPETPFLDYRQTTTDSVISTTFLGNI